MTNLAVTAQWYATIFYFKSVTCQQMGLANLVALSATTYIMYRAMGANPNWLIFSTSRVYEGFASP